MVLVGRSGPNTGTIVGGTPQNVDSDGTGSDPAYSTAVPGPLLPLLFLIILAFLWRLRRKQRQQQHQILGSGGSDT